MRSALFRTLVIDRDDYSIGKMSTKLALNLNEYIRHGKRVLTNPYPNFHVITSNSTQNGAQRHRETTMNNFISAKELHQHHELSAERVRAFIFK